eukprot:RCo012765
MSRGRESSCHLSSSAGDSSAFSSDGLWSPSFSLGGVLGLPRSVSLSEDLGLSAPCEGTTPTSHRSSSPANASGLGSETPAGPTPPTPVTGPLKFTSGAPEMSALRGPTRRLSRHGHPEACLAFLAADLRAFLTQRHASPSSSPSPAAAPAVFEAAFVECLRRCGWGATR